MGVLSKLSRFAKSNTAKKLLEFAVAIIRQGKPK